MTSSVAELATSIKELIGILQQETSFIRAGARGDLAALTDRKRQAAQRLEGLLTPANPRLKAATSSARAEIRGLAAVLESAVTENATTLAVARDASMRLVGLIIEAASQGSAAAQYNSRGKIVAENAELSRLCSRI